MTPSPGFFDLQVNGYGGVDFNHDGLTPESLHTACVRLAADGVDGILATIISEDLPIMIRRLKQLVHARAQDDLCARMIAGLHIEGPFLKPDGGYQGAHPPEAMRPADPDTAARLIEAGEGLVRLVTLAPEYDPGLRTTRWLSDRGVRVSAGHTDASLDMLRAATDNGLTLFTHVGNGCPVMMNRHDNIIQRALHLADRLWLCFIADGVHIPPFVLRNYLRMAGSERTVIVTDAMSAAGLGPGDYTISRWKVHVGDDMAARNAETGQLLGSAVTMKRSAHILHDAAGLSPTDIRLLTNDNPRRAMGLL